MPTKNKILTSSLLAICALLAACGGAEQRHARHLERGREYLDAASYEKARVEFRNAMRIAPENAETRYLAGVAAEKLEDVRNAVVLYQDAIQLDADHVRARTNLARLLLFGGLPERSMQILEPALAIAPDDPDVLTVRAGVRARGGDIAGARQDAEAALASAPAHENATAVLAGIYKEEGRSAAAIALLRSTLQALPNNVDLRVVLAQFLVNARDLEMARAELQTVSEIEPQVLRHRYRLAQVDMLRRDPESAERTLREAVAALPESVEAELSLVEFIAAQRSLDAAVAALDELLAGDASNQQMRLAAAEFNVRHGRGDSAEELYRAIIASNGINPNGLAARDRLATLRLAAGDDEEAGRLVEEVLRENPRDNEALVTRADMAMARGDNARAIADLRAVLRDQPRSTSMLRALARAHLRDGDTLLAEEHLRAAVEVDPKQVEARVELAALLAETGRAPEGRVIVDQVLLEDTANVRALESLFRIQAADGDWSGARATAATVQTIPTSQALGHYFEGLVERAAGDIDASVAAFAQALELQPDAVEPLTELVRAQVASNDPTAAIARLDAVIEENPSNAVAHNLKAEVLIGARRGGEAAAVATAASAIAPEWWKPYRTLALARLLMANPDGALDAYRRGIAAVGEGAVELRSELAELYARLDRAEDSIAEYDRLLAARPNLDLAANNLAVLLATYRTGADDLQRARDLAERFAESPNPAYRDTYGWVLYARGEYASAVSALQGVVAAAPDTAVYLYHLGMAQYRAGDTAAARTNLSAALATQQPFSGADEARQTLAALGR